jgi:serine/threonine-protein kinase
MAINGPRRLGKHRLIRRLAVGGTAEVYLAVTEGLSGFEKQVVLKRLIPEYAADPEVLAMFLDEARLMALLRHPHIAEVYDIGQDRGDYFFAMEHVPGRDLRETLRAAAGQPLPLGAAVGIVGAVAAALHHAHEQRDKEGQLLGVIHRDVSPSNVLLGLGGEVKLVDFGVAKWAAQRSRTEQGTLKGKFAYMSPEQCRAEPLDRRSDIFALGVLLYEATTGLRPFEAESDFEVLSAIVSGRLEPPSARASGYPPALEQVVLRALRAAPAERFATAAELGEALAAFAAGERLETGPATTAACLAERFPGALAGDDGATAGAEGAERDSSSATGPTAPSRERTATDWQGRPAAAAPSGKPAAAARRRTLVPVAAAVLVVAGAVSLVMARRSGTEAARAAPAAAVAGAAPAPAPPPPSRPSPPVAAPSPGSAGLGPAAPAAAGPTAADPTATPPKTGSARAARPAPRGQKAPPKSPGPTAPGLGDWDTDSPFLPPP